MMAKDGASLEKTPITAGFRVAFATFRRCHPDHEAAASYSRFLDQLDDIQDNEPTDTEGPGMLDPTQPADTDG
jgi:hypothetical protein